jgi:hypothetical protein
MPTTVNRVIDQVPAASRPRVLWVDVAADGNAQRGNGVPAWWPGPPQQR